MERGGAGDEVRAEWGPLGMNESDRRNAGPERKRGDKAPESSSEGGRLPVQRDT